MIYLNNIITVAIPFDLIETTPAEHQEKEDIIQESDATSSGDEMSDDESDDTDPAGLRDMSLGICRYMYIRKTAVVTIRTINHVISN